MPTYQRLIIYFFSGTGNSKNVALWVSELALKHSIQSEIIDIAKIDRKAISAPPTGSLVIIVSPVHGFNYPPIMLNFIWRFPKGKGSVLLMNTRAGMLVGKFITPGLTGTAFYLAAAQFKFKGYSIRGMIPVDLPSNWISVHPGLNKRTVEYLHVKNKERVHSRSERVILGKTNFIALREIVQDLVFAPISFGYYFFGRFLFSKTYYASNDCDNCGICIKNCPVKAIITKNNHPYWTFNCESCMKCMGNCPKKAIETGHGFIFALILINSLLLLPLFYRLCEFLSLEIRNIWLKFTFETVLFFLVLAASYRLIHFCMRFRFVERIMVYTSLTKYKWWGRRYKALKNK